MNTNANPYAQAQAWIKRTVDLAFTRGTPPPQMEDTSVKELRNGITRMFQHITKGKADYFEELIYDYVEEVSYNEELYDWYTRRIESKLSIDDIIAMSQ
jgi:hypothetical protein